MRLLLIAVSTAAISRIGLERNARRINTPERVLMHQYAYEYTNMRINIPVRVLMDQYVY